jgi:hypothetical protein
MNRLFLILSLLALAIFICWALTDLGNTAEREAAQRHGQSGAIGGGWGNAGRD